MTMNKTSVANCLGCSCIVLLVLSCVVGVFMRNSRQRESLGDAAKLYDAGQHDEAVEKYKESFAAAGTEKSPILKRIVAHELI